ncbi:MAG: hypothetical protein H7256_14760 [Bdellovibrio sp.]|nr:hypothetical protein [Bdellovibrio sp.]
MRHHLGLWFYGWGRIIMFASIVLILSLLATWYHISPLVKNSEMINTNRSIEN